LDSSVDVEFESAVVGDDKDETVHAGHHHQQSPPYCPQPAHLKKEINYCIELTIIILSIEKLSLAP
jgi:hypothetical protein